MVFNNPYSYARFMIMKKQWHISCRSSYFYNFSITTHSQHLQNNSLSHYFNLKRQLPWSTGYFPVMKTHRFLPLEGAVHFCPCHRRWQWRCLLERGHKTFLPVASTQAQKWRTPRTGGLDQKNQMPYKNWTIVIFIVIITAVSKLLLQSNRSFKTTYKIEVCRK